MAILPPPTSRPVIPDIDERIDFVLEFLIDGCDAPITVWMSKFWPAFSQLVLEWYAIDIKNIFTAFLRPGLFAIEGRSSRHWGAGDKGKRGKKGGWVTKAITFDPSEWIGKMIGGGEEVRARALPPGAAWMWIFEGTIERFLFYCMVLDLVTNFSYRWASSMVETKYCQAAQDAVFLGEVRDIPMLGIFGWSPVGALFPRKMRNISFFNGFGVAQTVGMGHISFTADIRPIEADPSGDWVRARLRCLTGPSAGTEVVEEHDSSSGEAFQIGLSTAARPGDVWIAETLANGAHMMDVGYLSLGSAWQH